MSLSPGCAITRTLIHPRMTHDFPSMRFLVCIKQVPLVWAMSFDPASRTLKREGVPNEVSAFDLLALARAVALRNEHGGEVVVLTMGPPQARAALEECLALGADRAIHLCDAALAGSDTLATARALAAAIRREPFDLILCGRHSVDAETGQVGPEVAELLDLPQITAVRRLEIDVAARRVRAERETDQGHDVVECSLPLLVSAAEDLAQEPEATREQREEAKNKPVATLALAELGLEPTEVGLEGSPTWVAGFETITSKRLGRLLGGESLEQSVDQLVRVLLGRGLFGTWSVDEVAPPPEIDSSPVARAGAKDVWVYAEWFGDVLRPVTLELLTKARQLSLRLGGSVTAVAIGEGCERFVESLRDNGADRVLLGDEPRLAHYDTDLYAALLSQTIRERRPGIVLVPSTAFGRDLAPRVAARLGLGLTGDCLDLELDAEGRLRLLKPAFGGSIVSPILSKTVPEMATVRAGVLHIAPPQPARRAVVERLVLGHAAAPRVRVHERFATAESATALDEAEIVIGVGMGLGGKDELRTLEPLAKVLDAAICATRDVTDAGWLERQYQVGFTGRSIAPRLYLAVGIRGAVYHMVGVRRAGIIVALNKDARAPMFKAADYGIAGDCAEVLPMLTRRLERARQEKR